MKTLIVTGTTYTGVDELAVFVNEIASGFNNIDKEAKILNKKITKVLVASKNQSTTGIPDTLVNEAQELITKNSGIEGISWCDDNAIHLLDFWKKTSEAPVFILNFCSPEYCISQYLKFGGDSGGRNEIVSNWRKSIRSMLDFFQKNRNICVLVNIETLKISPQKIVDAIGGKTIPLSNKSIKGADFKIEEDDPIISMMASWAVIQNDELLDIYEEAESAATVAITKKSRLLSSNRPSDETLNKAWEKYQADINNELELNRQLVVAQQQINQFQIVNETTAKETKQLKNKIESLKKDLEENNTKFKILNEDNKQFLEKLIDKEAELELTALQLDQTSEELEQLFNTDKEKINQLEIVLNEKTAELEVTLMLLQNMQVELEAYFNKSKQLEEKLQSGGYNQSNILERPLLRLIRATR